MTIHPYTRLFSKASDPTTGDDSSLGYEAGDHIVTSSKIWLCRDVTVGAAVWIDLTASGGYSQEQIEDFVGAMFSGNTETGIDVTYDDPSGKINLDAQTAGDARYAPLAKGVTNGDTHDHVGGDGGTIAYSSLSGAPSIPGQEEIEDFVGGMVSENTETGITVTYDDIGGKLDFSVDVPGTVHGYTSKTSEWDDNDEFLLVDADASYVGKKGLWSTLKTQMYNALSVIGAVLPASVAISDFLVGDGTGTWIKKTLAQTLVILGLASGTYTPTLTNTTNISSSSLNQDFIYSQNGSVVTVCGSVQANPTAAGACTLTITIPVASNFGTSYDANGNVTAPGANPGSIIAEPTADKVEMRWTAPGAGNVFWRMLFQYRII